MSGLKNALEYLLEAILKKILMILGLFPGMILARNLDECGLLNFGSPMKNLAAFCIVIFLTMLFYVLFPILIAPKLPAVPRFVGFVALFSISAVCFYFCRLYPL